MEYRKIKDGDVNEIVLLHNLAFKDFFLTSLGNDFLSVYYASVLNEKKGLLVGVYEDQQLVGFCATTTYSKGFNKFLIRNNLSKFLWVAIKLLFTKPMSLIRLYKNLTKKALNVEDNGDYAEILSIATAPRVQGLGYGKGLISYTEKLLKEQKTIFRLSLTTDYYNNEKAIAFYKKIGFNMFTTITTYPNRKMYRLIKNL